MRMSKANFDKMKTFEDCHLAAFRDSTGVKTIGYGRTWGVYMGMTITQEQAEAELVGAVERLENVLEKIPVLSELPPNKWDAIVSFTMKTGVNNLKKSVLLKKIKSNPLNKKIFIEFLRWVKGNEATVQRLTERRQWEARLWEGEV